MTTLLFLLSIMIFCFSMAIFQLKKQKRLSVMDQKFRDQKIGNNMPDTYQLYKNWCKRVNEIPVSEEVFNKWTEENGKEKIVNLLKSNYTTADKNPTDFKTIKAKEEADRKKRDDQFFASAAIGYMTNSTAKGTLLGGSLLGGMLGNHLKNKKNKK